MMHRRAGAVIVAASLAFGAWLAGCGSDDSSVFDGGVDAQANDGQSVQDTTVGDTNPFGDTGPTQITSLTIQPQNPIVQVTITDGIVSTTPLTFQALGNGSIVVPASFTLDKGELGSLVASTGVFTASGNVSGVGTVTASYQSGNTADGGPLLASTNVTVQITMSQNGKPTSQSDAGADSGKLLGGNNGVGGNDYGSAVTTQQQTVLDGTATQPANAAELGFLYPYDKTVWPQGILAPLLQWQSTHASATTAVKIHLQEKGFAFDGYYQAPGWVNEPIDETAWRQGALRQPRRRARGRRLHHRRRDELGPHHRALERRARRLEGHRLLQLVQLAAHEQRERRRPRDPTGRDGAFARGARHRHGVPRLPRGLRERRIDLHAGRHVLERRVVRPHEQRHADRLVHEHRGGRHVEQPQVPLVRRLPGRDVRDDELDARARAQHAELGFVPKSQW